jgi:hypothetical protein
MIVLAENAFVEVYLYTVQRFDIIINMHMCILYFNKRTKF